MSVCLGISLLGSCAYDPSNPATSYFSIGEAAAALSITLIIPQFLKPIYHFRLATQSIRLSHIYMLVFLGATCALIAAILPNIGLPQHTIFAYPVLWELIGGVLFIVSFGALVFAVLRPARARRHMYRRFARAAADFLAHASKQDQSDFSKDLLRNIDGLIEVASFVEFRPPQERSAFFVFRYRREIEDAWYAWSLLKLVAEPQFCETLVHRRPWDTAAMLQQVSNRNLQSRAAQDFVREIGRQSIISRSSMMAREVGYKGFYAAPVLSHALFEDSFINTHYQPLSGLEYGDLSNLEPSTIERLNHAIHATLTDVLETGRYWHDMSLAQIDIQLGSAANDAHRQVRANKDNYHVVSEIGFGLRHLITDTARHLDGLNPETYDKLYARAGEKRDRTTLDYLSEAIVKVLYAFANDFEGYDDALWFTAVDVIGAIFGQFGDQPEGMNPCNRGWL